MEDNGTHPHPIHTLPNHYPYATRTLRQCHHHLCLGCCDWRPHRDRESGRVPLASYLRIVAAKFLLEVVGASGAVWGSSEVLLLRATPEANERARAVAFSTGGVFLVRYWWHARHWWRHERDYLPIKTQHRRTHWLPFLQIHSSAFVLQVLGGAGAIWGCSEAVGLRNGDNTTGWRAAAISVGAMFLIRWAFQMLAYCLYLAESWADPQSKHMKILRWYEALVVKLVLEVFGAVGAVWGFSEIATLRNAATNEIWRPKALAVGAVFLLRWFMHLIDFAKPERESRGGGPRPAEAQHSEIDDLELRELTSTDSSNKSTSAEVCMSTKLVDKTLSDRPASPTPTNPSTPLKRQKKRMANENDLV